jgi:hypothetical protein
MEPDAFWNFGVREIALLGVLLATLEFGFITEVERTGGQSRHRQ